MLFVTTLKSRGGNVQERLARRMEWNYPPGIKLIAEYWLMNPNSEVISIYEADSMAPIMATVMAWADSFEITVVPALTAEEGLQMARQMKQG